MFSDKKNLKFFGVFLFMAMVFSAQISLCADSHKSKADKTTLKISPTSSSADSKFSPIAADLASLESKLADLRIAVANDKKSLFDSVLYVSTLLIALFTAFLAYGAFVMWRNHDAIEDSIQGRIESNLQDLIKKTIRDSLAKDVEELRTELSLLSESYLRDKASLNVNVKEKKNVFE